MTNSLKGQFIIAMPGMEDERFQDSVIYLVGHGEDGAMGLVINHVLPDMKFTEILEEMELGSHDELIKLPGSVRDREVLRGGPVEKGRGFVLHSPDYFGEGNTYSVTDDVCLTATLDVLKAISYGPGPEKSLFALGYCGWSPGQLEAEIKANGWLTAPHSDELLFGTRSDQRYDAALSTLGVTRAQLSAVTDFNPGDDVRPN